MPGFFQMKRNDCTMMFETKRLFRQEYARRRSAITEHAARSRAICAQINRLSVFQAARVLHCYLPMRSEVDTLPLLRQALARDMRVVVPVVQRDSSDLAHSWLLSAELSEIVPGVFGTPQPRTLHAAMPGDWDMMVVPLLAFDRRGYRLGYGGGYYDRLLAAAPPVVRIGVAFAVQEADQLPHEEHDIPLDWIVTEQEVIAIRQPHAT
jgi:5-formyltetrahydrofolate cyclo-ligase